MELLPKQSNRAGSTVSTFFLLNMLKRRSVMSYLSQVSDVIFMGIDISANFFHYAILDENRKIVEQVDEQSSKPGDLKKWIKDFTKSIPKELTVQICMEHTGVYSIKVAKVLREAELNVYMVAPQLLKKMQADKKAKTDRLDALALADYVSRYSDTLKIWNPKTAEIEALNELMGTREMCLEHRTAYKNKIKSTKHVSPQSAIIPLLEKEVRHLKKVMDKIEKQMDEIVKANEELNEIRNLSKSVDGVGNLLSYVLIIATNGFENCLNAKEFRSYLGIAPIPNQSGISKRPNAKSTGHGPRIARRLLYLAAESVSYHRPVFREYYLRKIAEGKPKSIALNNIENKLINIIWAVVKNKRQYIPGYKSVEPRIINKMS